MDASKDQIHPSFFISQKKKGWIFMMNRQEVMAMVGYLAGLVILCMIVVPVALRKYALIISTVGWALAVYSVVRKKKRQETQKTPMQIIDIEPDYKKLFVQQLMIRIDEKIKSRFPEAVIELTENDMLRMVTAKRAICVAVRQADAFSHMNIALRQDGSICMNLFSLVDFDQIHAEEKKVVKLEEETAEVRQWFEQKGQRQIAELITNMNSRGYRRLSIKENGEVVVEEDGKSVVKDYFPDIPKKKDWRKLKALLSEAGVESQTGKMLTMSW